MGKQRIWTGSIVLLVVALLAARFLWPVYTPGIGGGRGVFSLETIEIGGAEQTVLIRGNDRNNPVLLKLHGGPGSSEMMFSRLHRELEKDFVVVTWDQRGAGKSYHPELSANDMTIDRFVDDARELTLKLKERFGQEKIYLMGHSWGTIIGWETVQRHPEHYAAYIAVSQVVDYIRNESLAYETVRGKAEAEGDVKTLEKLAALGERPYRTLNAAGGFMTIVQANGGSIHTPMSNMLLLLLGSTEHGWRDIAQFSKSTRFSLNTMLDQLVDYQIAKERPKTNVPTFFVSGKYDLQANPALVREFYEKLEAPTKKFYVLDRSAHSPQYEQFSEFRDILIHEILPSASVGRRN